MRGPFEVTHTMSTVRSLTTLLVALLMTGLLAGGAVAQSPSPSAVPGSQLTDTEWLLTQAAIGGSLVNVPAGVVATLRLSDGEASGSGGCNRFFGSYTAADPTVDAGDLTFGPIGSTLMLCPEPSASTETAYLTLLGTVASYAIDNGILTLSDAGGNAVLVYAYDIPSLVGAWLVTGFNNGSGVTSPLLGSELTADFAPDGTVSGNAGCNHFSAGYTTHDTTAVTFGPIVTTLMACPSADLQTQETQYLAALAASTVWSQSPGSLSLTDATGATQVTFIAIEQPTYVGSWDVTGINNGQNALVSVTADAGLTATLLPGGDIEGYTGCNAFFGTYTVVGTAITIGPLGTTRVACPSDALAAQEQEYLNALQASATWDIEPHGLTLRDASGAMQVTFMEAAAKIVAPTPTPAPTAKPTPTPTPKPTASPTAKPTPTPTPKPTPSPTPKPTPSDALSGTNWTLVKFTDGKGADVPLFGASDPVTLDFASGATSGSASCNTYNGTYKLSNPFGISLTVGSSTQKACSDAQTALETAYLGALPKVNTWEINKNNGNLILTSGKSTLRLVFEPAAP